MSANSLLPKMTREGSPAPPPKPKRQGDDDKQGCVIEQLPGRSTPLAAPSTQPCPGGAQPRGHRQPPPAPRGRSAPCRHPAPARPRRSRPSQPRPGAPRHAGRRSADPSGKGRREGIPLLQGSFIPLGSECRAPYGLRSEMVSEQRVRFAGFLENTTSLPHTFYYLLTAVLELTMSFFSLSAGWRVGSDCRITVCG